MDIQALLQPAAEEGPCGPSLEYEPAFAELTQMIDRPADPARGPDWGAVQEKAVELLGISKNLRIALILARSALYTEGFAGFRDGLTVLSGLLDQYWDNLHPELEENGTDATARLMTILSLCHPSHLHEMRGAPLVSAPGLGAFSHRQVMVAEGKATAAEGEESADPNDVAACFMAAPRESLDELAQALAGCLEQVDAIDGKLTEALGAAGSPDMDPLRGVLKEISGLLRLKLEARGDGAGGEETQAGEAEGGAASAPAQAARPSGPIQTRHEAAQLLDQISAYFERNEPSSPVPLLLQRAKRLIDKNFIDLLEDLAPDGVQQAEVFRGNKSE